MSLFYVLLGSLIPSIVGWLLLDLLEGRSRAITLLEKCAGAFLAGTTLSMFVIFLVHELTGAALTFSFYMEIFGGLSVVLAIPCYWKWTKRQAVVHETAESPMMNKWLQGAILGFAGWVAVRLLVFTFLLFTTPTFFDDTLDNWNLRGKLFFVDQKLSFMFPWSTDAGVSSYPPTVPLLKAWLATLNGAWVEGTVNGLHIVWFAALLVLVYATLRRAASWQWSLLGTTLLASLPLEFIQGTGTYADIFVSAHVLLPVAMLFAALRSHDAKNVAAYLRIAAFTIALVPFTKNEGWALYFPMLVFVHLATVVVCARKKTLQKKNVMAAVAWLMFFCAVIVMPWIAFKVINGLAFGNAKGIDFAFAWQPQVLPAIAVNTFMEANWIFLFPLAMLVLAMGWRGLKKPELLLLLVAFLLPYGAQHVAYFFTGLSQEAIFQTGYARGLVHIIPLLVILTMLLLKDLLKPRHS
jgi:hypothetical protein